MKIINILMTYLFEMHFIYRKVRKSVFFLIFSFMVVITGVNAQLYSPGADFAKKISYKTYTGSDSVFVFHNYDGLPKKGSLTALPPVAGVYTFEWSKYNSVSGGFDTPFYSQNDAIQSVLEDLNEGGYKVRITNTSGFDTSFVAWIFLNELRVEIEKDDQGKIKPGKYTCDFLIINGEVIPDTFYYYDLNSNEEPIWLLNDYRFIWTSDNPDLIIPNADKILDPNITYRPPYIDTRYFLTAIDSFGMEVKDEVLYETIHVKSDFSLQAFNKEESKIFEDINLPFEDGSPLTIKFTNKSLNGYQFEWIFADSARSGFFSNEYSSDVNYEPEFTYLVPNDYYPALVAESFIPGSPKGCVDTFRISDRITVLPSLVNVPNVFTPDGDDLNRYFKVEHRSIKEFSIIIMNRWGKVVYRADVKDMYEWEGWDGNVLNTNNPASPGPYFYVIEARGWDNEKYVRGQYRGTVYLFRGE